MGNVIRETVYNISGRLRHQSSAAQAKTLQFTLMRHNFTSLRLYGNPRHLLGTKKKKRSSSIKSTPFPSCFPLSLIALRLSGGSASRSPSHHTLGAFWRLCCLSLDFAAPNAWRSGSEEDSWRDRAAPEPTSCSTAGPLFSRGAGFAAIISHESFHMGREAGLSHHCFFCLSTKKKR